MATFSIREHILEAIYGRMDDRTFYAYASRPWETPFYKWDLWPLVELAYVVGTF